MLDIMFLEDLNMLFIRRHMRSSGPGSRIRVRTEIFFSYFSTETYVVGTQMNRLNEMVLLNTQNTCLKYIFTELFLMMSLRQTKTSPQQIQICENVKFEQTFQNLIWIHILVPSSSFIFIFPLNVLRTVTFSSPVGVKPSLASKASFWWNSPVLKIVVTSISISASCYNINIIQQQRNILSRPSKVTLMLCFVYKVIRDL